MQLQFAAVVAETVAVAFMLFHTDLDSLWDIFDFLLLLAFSRSTLLMTAVA